MNSIVIDVRDLILKRCVDIGTAFLGMEYFKSRKVRSYLESR